MLHLFDSHHQINSKCLLMVLVLIIRFCLRCFFWAVFLCFILSNLNLDIISRSRGRCFNFNHVTSRISAKMKNQERWRSGKYFNIISIWCDHRKLLRQNIPQNQTQWMLGIRFVQDTRVFIPVLPLKKLNLQW